MDPGIIPKQRKLTIEEGEKKSSHVFPNTNRV